MAWHILICATLLTVNIFGHGLISESEANKLSLNIDENQNVIELFKRDTPKKLDESRDNIYGPIDKILRNFLKEENLKEVKDTFMYKIFEKMKSYYEKNKEGSLSEMLEGLVCQLRRMRYFGGTSTVNLMDIINNIDTKPTCSKEQQKKLLEKVVKMHSFGHWLIPKNIFDFIQSDLFKAYFKLIGIPDEQIAMIISVAFAIDKNDIVNWKMFDVGKRFMCHLTITDFTKIDTNVLTTTMSKMLSKPTCTEDQLKTKWEELVTSFSLYIRPYILEFTDQVANDINKWPGLIMDGLKKLDLKGLKMEIVNIILMINRTVDNIFSNVQKSSNRDWTITDLVKNFMCGMNITDFSKLDGKYFMKWIERIGDLDICNKKQEETAWDNYLNAMAMVYVNMTIDLNRALGNMNFGDIAVYITDGGVKYIQFLIGIAGIKELDTVVESVWENIKNNPNEQLNVDYILKFLSCNIKENEINTFNSDKLMKIMSQFGQPISCKLQKDWLKDILKLLWKLEYEMAFQQLDQLQTYIGDFNTEDLKDAVKEAKMVKDLAMVSFIKVSQRSDEWITYIGKNDSVLNMSTIATQFICSVSKADLSTMETTIISFGKVGTCTESESKQITEGFLNKLTESKLGELKEFLIGIGIYTGKIDNEKMKVFASKLVMNLHKYSLQFESMIPQELKDLTIAKVMHMISTLSRKLDEIYMCMVKAVLWRIFDLPGAPTLLDCLFQEKPVVNPGKKPGGDLDARYEVGADFPFDQKSDKKDDEKMLLEKLLKFNRETNTEKEERILKYVIRKVVRYLMDNPKELKNLEMNKESREHILALARLVDQATKLRMKMDMKMDKETLSKMKVSTDQEAKKILRRAMKDMEVGNMSTLEKNEIIKDLSPDLLKKSGTAVIDKLFSPETRDAFIERFKNKPKSSEQKGDGEDEIDEEEEETESLTKLSLMNKLTQGTPDNTTMALMLKTSLVSLVSIKMFKTVQLDEVCSMQMDTRELKDDQIQYTIDSCPKAVEKIAKTKPSALGKLGTKLTKEIVKSLTLDELIKVTFEACKHERKLDIDLEMMLKDHYITQKLNPKINGTRMFCVLKHVQQDLDWKSPEIAIKICQTLGRSMMKKIAPKNAESFKNNCMKLLKDGNITFADMGSMNAYLKLADVQKLMPKIILQGAVVLTKYVNDPSVFNEIGKKLSGLQGFSNRSAMTTDHVAQANIFIAAWSDALLIPKSSIDEAFENLASSVKYLQKKKSWCVTNGNEMTKCNAMDETIKKIVDILIKSTISTNTRRKRSTVSCSCSKLVSLGMAAVQITASEMSDMICTTNFDECMEGLSQITDWNDDHRKVFVEKAIAIWGKPSSWNSTHMSTASAIIPGLSTEQIKMLSSMSRDNAFELGKQKNWGSKQLTEIFVVFAVKVLDNTISSITSYDLQLLGNIVCGISVNKIQMVPKASYINAANQIGTLTICSEAQYTAWAKKALAEYGEDVNKWGLAEISSIGSVINGFNTLNLQKLSKKQITAISIMTIPKIMPTKLASFHPMQIDYLTTSQAQVVTTAQKAEMTEEQKNILKKKALGYIQPTTSGGQRIGGTNYMKMLTPLLLIATNLLSGI